MYIYEQPAWPSFSWDQGQLLPLLTSVYRQQGHLMGQMSSIGLSLQEEVVLQTLTQDVLKSSEIEGESLDMMQVRSSIARHLGMDIAGLKASDRHVDGMVEMMLDATQNFNEPLTKNRLFRWHTALFPTDRSGLSRIRVGAWRNDSQGPMQVISGPIGHERVHYQAPPASQLEQEMDCFLRWFNSRVAVDPILKAGIAHLWFVTVHPFEDGNGRISRAIADLLLARCEQSSQRFYSLSKQIQRERKAYYDLLEHTQKGGLEITPWLVWFLECMARAIENAQAIVEATLYKARFWESIVGLSLNPRQHAVLKRLLDGIEGKLTTSKWAKFAKCSQDTAYRDILELVHYGVLIKDPAGGRSTSYSLVIPKHNFL